ncbi:MAG: 4-hydroxy-3-methylbut-2-enyl diphosphate reductase [Candidatus Woykebacteria bacterium RBG_13_40_7b]|uniref:4-hydroxy-3-methylbut-2-enyl diphosphate reductase n=1 Tax=Candidatus Woykebacteria bacterium RBG_13_40_7b TaxID=1802594 RepID=A0A1G1WAQ5_9BACT|nr:MAG: 4-hydroxy-3-methylbut-2-enyl diphosphate reductase [Candidatus Woykebacteria bacterium RBG_13_40_7b]
MIETLLLARPRGFCAGVARAITTVEEAIKKFGKPIWVKHAIVHNVHVVKDLEKKGAVFVERVEEIPQGAKAIFSAHGSPPEDFQKAKERNIHVIDAVCPLVTKVHIEAKIYAEQGYSIIYVGHRGHPEPLGVEGEVKAVGGGKFFLIDTLEEAKAVMVEDERVAILTQTTLSIDDTAEIVEVLKQKFPHAYFPPKEDICYATQNRQNAVKLLAKEAEVILVIGSKSSSNSNRLREVAEAAGKKAYLIDDSSMIRDNWFKEIKKVGLTSGASAPEYLIEEVIDYFKKLGVEEIKDVVALEENIYFPLPVEVG